jgi:hypothetical protein
VAVRGGRIELTSEPVPSETVVDVPGFLAAPACPHPDEIITRITAVRAIVAIRRKQDARGISSIISEADPCELAGRTRI